MVGSTTDLLSNNLISAHPKIVEAARCCVRFRFDVDEMIIGEGKDKKATKTEEESQE